jgi:hypothetical protein
MHGASWSPYRRLMLGALGLVCLIVVAAATAWFTGRGGQHASPSHAPSAPHRPAPSSPSPGRPTTGAVARPPQIADPLQFSKAAAQMLWSYDTRATSHEQQLDGMEAWMTKEGQYADWSSVSAQVPDPDLWSQMASQAQHATATVTEAHYPSAFTQAVNANPSEITKAYIYAVTVTGRQSITWRGGSGAESRSVTLAVQCHPSHDCSLVALAPSVAP